MAKKTMIDLSSASGLKQKSIDVFNQGSNVSDFTLD
jgi:hypothetical protein